MRVPKTIGVYTLLEPVAAGGSGHVFRAQNQRTGGVVALKWVLGADPATVQLEVWHTVAPRHENIVPLLDYGVHDGSAYLVTAWMEGGTLRQAPPRDWHGVLAVLNDTLAALAYAHSWGIVHCDVKPENILWGHGRWALTDFGISHAMNKLTVESVARATPHYAAPELISGARGAQRPWTDLYSLAAMCWELVTAQTLFSGATQEVLLAHRSQEPGPFRPAMAVPDGLETVLRTLLSKNPSHRCELAADAQSALAALGPPVTPTTAVSVAPAVALTIDLLSLDPIGEDVAATPVFDQGLPAANPRAEPDDLFPRATPELNPRIAPRTVSCFPPPPSHRLWRLVEGVRQSGRGQVVAMVDGEETRRALGWLQGASGRAGQTLGLHLDVECDVRGWLTLASGDSLQQIAEWCGWDTVLAQRMHQTLHTEGPLDLDVVRLFLEAVARRRPLMLRLDAVDRFEDRLPFADALSAANAPILCVVVHDSPATCRTAPIVLPPLSRADVHAAVSTLVCCGPELVDRAIEGRSIRQAVDWLAAELGW